MDHAEAEEFYLINPAHVVEIRRVDGAWWRAADVRGKVHDISADDDAKVEALMRGTGAEPDG